MSRRRVLLSLEVKHPINLKFGDNGEEGMSLYNYLLQNLPLELSPSGEYEWLISEIDYTFSCGEKQLIYYFSATPDELQKYEYINIWTKNTACGAPVQFVRLYKDGTIEEYLDD